MLTEFEKEKIELMREFGLRYDEIAKRLGVTKNQVRYYCKKIGCLLRVDEMPNKRCAYCRKKITADRYVPNKKFCNRSCRKKYVIQSRGYSYEWVWCKCQYCGKDFQGWDYRKFCSRVCAQLSREKPKKEKSTRSTLINPESEWKIKSVRKDV